MLMLILNLIEYLWSFIFKFSVSFWLQLDILMILNKYTSIYILLFLKNIKK